MTPMQDTKHKYSCAASIAIGLLQGKRRIEILCAMGTGLVRLGQPARLIPEISKKVLTDNLRKTEGFGLVVMIDLSGLVRHVEYDLTAAIENETYALLDELEKWATHCDNANCSAADKEEGQVTE
jgi:DNA-binding HxlR family transcriptional regulator